MVSPAHKHMDMGKGRVDVCGEEEELGIEAFGI